MAKIGKPFDYAIKFLYVFNEYSLIYLFINS
jgi:hypothetical protein